MLQLRKSQDGSGFSNFSKLPQELQNMIWEFSIEPDELEPRVVEVRFTQDKRSNKHNFVSDIPPLLHRKYIAEVHEISPSR
jgi:hypothetical protein